VTGIADYALGLPDLDFKSAFEASYQSLALKQIASFSFRHKYGKYLGNSPLFKVRNLHEIITYLNQATEFISLKIRQAEGFLVKSAE
jgi:hypothetical protein